MSEPINGWIKYSERKQYHWQPKEDITVYELALCVQVLILVLDRWLDVEPLIENLPESARRHFRIVLPSE